MKSIKIILILLFAFSFINIYSQSGNISNVLVLYHENDTAETTYQILNLNHSIFAEIKSVDGNEPSCPKLKGKILAYYDDYYIFHFEVKLDDDSNFYKVKVGNLVKLIKKSDTVKMYSMEEYILKYYCLASELNPLRDRPSISGKIIKIDYQATSFICLEVKGDWVRVKCDKECEGCPRGKIIMGWIRWRKNGKIIFDQRFVC
jgi:hypothetical protein